MTNKIIVKTPSISPLDKAIQPKKTPMAIKNRPPIIKDIKQKKVPRMAKGFHTESSFTYPLGVKSGNLSSISSFMI